MARSLAALLIAMLAVHYVVSSPAPVNPLNLKKHHGAMCGVCKELVKGGEEIGEADLDEWLNTNIGTLCWTLLLVIHHECEKELKEVKKDLKKAIEDGVPPEKACKDVDLC
ncbi:unnamed protein product [Caenorhabditis bovis]|uniref:Saposin B-type domain-containing protein n=1 Tax=Caenorhabditis bovis TaxID=2654633 RepID=A0A8S1EN81_9PELO|nr:unnamed protein product [Caenorhabditis bovis]